MSTGLEGKTALITGASRGIGRASAFALAARGANVVLSSRKQDTLDEVAAEIRAAHPGVGVLAKAAHVAHEDEAAACVDATVAEFGSLDVLVNNAGTNPYFGPIVDIDATRAQKIVEINQFSVVAWTRLAWHASMSANGGAVINIASIGGMATEIGIGYYNASKAAVIHITRQLAAELGPNTRVNAVAPGIVRTHLAKALWENYEAELNKALPLGRIGEPEDIAKAVAFLAGDDAGWITGHTLVVDGGALVRPGIA